VCCSARSARPQQRTHIDSRTHTQRAGSALVWKKHKPQLHSRSFLPSKFTLSANKRVAAGGREHRSRSHFSPSTEPEEKRSNQQRTRAAINKKKTAN
jgi:hypothetical protein